MQTTGLAEERMDGLYEGERLGPALRDARRRTLDLYAHLDLATLRVPQLAIVNPPAWELAHIAWFQEYWCLRGATGVAPARHPSMLEGADALFDSGRVAHGTRWSLPYPPLDRLRRYGEETLEATLAALPHGAGEDPYYFQLALLHEDMHGEALSMTLQTLGLPAPPWLAAREPPPSRPTPCGDVEFEGGEFEQGTPREASGFIFDNEKWAHPARVAPFAMAERPVTQGEFAAFVEDHGYERPQLWSAEGWRWKAESGAAAPRYWRRESGGWMARRFDQWRPIEPHSPMVHANFHEALAWCRWAGRRLPTESEWELAARNGGRDVRYPWGDAPRHCAGLDLERCAPLPSSTDGPGSPRGLRGLLGGVWEWCATPFAPYPGFSPDAYSEYSAPWFHDHYVLRGGSFATRSRLVHNRFRNFYLAERGDVFAGFRTCAAGRDAAPVS
jgi:iron(II)-dependent oxidoreductase